MPLNIIIVGAGIAGLSAGIALRQAGHVVQIFEKSEFAAEVGAALIVSPNGAKVLSRLGFSFENAQAVPIARWDVLRGDNLALLARKDLSAAEQEFGAGVWAVHRVDLHTSLLRLATSEVGPGRPVRIRLGADVVAVAPASGSITLRDGSQHTADVVIGADGLHSTVRRAVLGENAGASATGLSAFRFLIDTERLCASPALAATLAKKGPGATLLADVENRDQERHIMWYACRSGRVQNFVGIHPTREVDGETGDVDIKRAMTEEFGHFAPEMLEIINYEPLTKWYSGRALLIGDAAHPMLPFGGQGSNSALEDSGTLGYLFGGIDSVASVPGCLELFQRARQARTARIQILSGVRAGQEGEVQTELRKYADPPGSDVPADFGQRVRHDYSFDVREKCDEVLRSHGSGNVVVGAA